MDDRLVGFQRASAAADRTLSPAPAGSPSTPERAA
jgi:hypothetical protein